MEKRLDHTTWQGHESSGGDDIAGDTRGHRGPSACIRARGRGGGSGRSDLELPAQAWRGPRRARRHARPHRAGAGARHGRQGYAEPRGARRVRQARSAGGRGARPAENIAYGYESFDKTLGQWIDSSEHRKNLLLHNASRVGIASARDASGKRTYWAMVIAGDYETKPPKRGEDSEPVVA